MKGWMIFALVVVLFFLFEQIRVGVDARYGEEGALIKVRIGCFRIKVFPRPTKPPKADKKAQKKSAKTEKPQGAVQTQQAPMPQAEKPAANAPAEQSEAASPAKPETPPAEEKPVKAEKKAKKQKKKKKDQQEPEKKAGKKMTPEQILGLAREFVPLALEAVGGLWSRLVMDELELSVVVGSSDPADAAMLYGKINAAMAALWYPLNEACHVKNGRAHVDVDFNAQNITLYAHGALSIKIGQILQLASILAVKALGKLLKLQKEQKAKEQARKAV